MAEDLDFWLGRAYHANNIGSKALGMIEDSFIGALKEDDQMRKDAGKRLASLTEDLVKRDHISKVHRDTLERVIQRMKQDG